jgi:hypothetical protein
LQAVGVAASKACEREKENIATSFWMGEIARALFADALL